MPAGAPTLYRKEYNEIAIEHFKAGKTIVQLAARFEVCRETIYAWGRENPEFSDTLQKGKMLAQSYYENISQIRMLGQSKSNDFDVSKVSEKHLEFILKTRFRDDYSEKAQAVHILLLRLYDSVYIA